MKRLPAVIANANNIMALSAIRSLGRRGIPVICVFGKGAKYEPFRRIVRASNYIAQIFDFDETRVSYAEALTDCLLKVAQKFEGKGVLFPVSDEDMIIASKEREKLQSDYHLLMPAHTTLEKLLNKVEFAAIASENALPIPKTLVLSQNRDEGQFNSWDHFPCIVKPSWRNYEWRSIFGNRKVIIVGSSEELKEVLKNNIHGVGPLLVQEIIEGPETNIFCSFAFLNEHSESKDVFVCKKIRQFPPYYGNSSMVVSVSAPEVADLARRIGKLLGLVGYVSVEFKKSKVDGNYKILEITPSRLNRQVGLAEICGMSLPHLWYGHFADSFKSAEHYELGVKWVSEVNEARSFFHYLAKQDFTFLSWMRSYAGLGGCEIFARDDIRPFLYLMVESFRAKAAVRSRSRFSEPPMPTSML